MCGRFYVAQDEENELLAAMIREAGRRRMALTGQGGVAVGEVLPTAAVAALARGKSGAESAYPMQWGFHLDGKKLLINTRSETALQKPLFRDAMRQRRCLIPASWYFEWQTGEGQPGFAGVPAPAGKRVRIKYAIRPKAEGLMYLAAIYRREPGAQLPALSILTCEAAPEIAFIHPRMPVIFTGEARRQWLDPDADPEFALGLRAREMTCGAVGGE